LGIFHYVDQVGVLGLTDHHFMLFFFIAYLC